MTESFLSKRQLLQFSLITCFLLLIGCEPRQSLPTGAGFVETSNGPIWYRITGQGDGTPLLLLHGGPGFSSHYLNPMKALGVDRPVIFIDQPGSGRSVTLRDTSLMTIDHFVEQIHNVKSALGLKSYYIYGHSWGTMLAMDYYLKYPEGIEGIVFASPLFSTAMWTRDAEELISQLPDTTQQDIRHYTKLKAYDAPEYQEAMDQYYRQYLARKQPWDADLDSTFSMINMEVYNYMWGPSEFKSTGTLSGFDRLEEAASIQVPTLFVAGEFDEAQPATVQYYQQLVPHSRFEEIKGAAHMLMHDQPEAHHEVISGFLLANEPKQ